MRKDKPNDPRPPWTFNRLTQIEMMGWPSVQRLETAIDQRQPILVTGRQGSSRSAVIEACAQLIPAKDTISSTSTALSTPRHQQRIVDDSIGFSWAGPRDWLIADGLTSEAQLKRIDLATIAVDEIFDVPARVAKATGTQLRVVKDLLRQRNVLLVHITRLKPTRRVAVTMIGVIDRHGDVEAGF